MNQLTTTQNTEEKETIVKAKTFRAGVVAGPGPYKPIESGGDDVN